MRSSRATKRWRTASCSYSRSRTLDARSHDCPTDRPRGIAPKITARPCAADPGGDRLDQLGVQPSADHEGRYLGRSPSGGVATHHPVAFMFSGVLALGSTLVAAPSIASDIESGIALAILP